MPLDASTLLVCAFLLLLVCAGALCSFWWLNRSDRAVGLWTAALFCVAAAVALFALRHLLHDWLVSVTGNVLIVLGYLLILSGARAFVERPALPWGMLLALAAASTAVLAALVAYEAGVFPRVVYHAVAVALSFGAAAWTLVRGSEDWAHARRALGLVFAAHALFYVVFVAWLGWTGNGAGQRLDDLPHYAVTTALEGVVVLVVGVVLLVQMLAERHSARLARDLVHDALTGILNRRGFEDAVERELARRGERQVPVQLAIIDIDHFKRVNDTCGHQGGDRVLREVAATLRQELRAAEPLGRIGGEEFGLLVRVESVAALEQVMERLRLAVERMQVRLADGRTVAVTISAGVAMARLPPRPFELRLQLRQFYEALFAGADAALYLAKGGGRNRVEYRDLRERG